ncbi:hypothetical protein CLTEP_06060 [Clostridium tepidiprofundi DSM 19306]|uniref:DUF4129 domain-containing protein n=2 Tax=Clostridium TaxID=1485 RepID=A0A151B6M7_9CLOT|nr:hypothetical protein CLTEP_06060 [Clostridium tepidiprofundi DSM 19306]
MSWFRQVKTIYNIFFQLLFFIIWCIVGKIFFNIYVDESIFLISLLGIFLMQFLKYKFNNLLLWKKYKFVLPIGISLVACTVLMIIFNIGNVIFSIVFIVISIYISYRYEDEVIDYYTYRDRVQKGLILFIFFGVIISFTDKCMSILLSKYYIFIIVTAVLLLRESRRYSFKIRNKRSYFYNIVIAITIILFSIDKVFLIFKTIFYWIFSEINKLFQVVVNIVVLFLMKILEKPFLYLKNFIVAHMNENTEKLLDNLVKGDNTINANIRKDYASTIGTTALDIAIKILLIALVVFAIYKIVIGHKKTKGVRFELVTEEKEKIINRKKKSIFRDLARKILKGKGSINEQILYVYKKFQIMTLDKNIFKPHMNATQLSNVTKLYVDDVEDLDSISQIYNEAKFSQHDMKNDDLKIMKQNYKNIERQL